MTEAVRTVDPGLPASVDRDPLAWILAPVAVETFVSTYLGTRHLVCRNGDPARFAPLLSMADLDAVLGTYGLRFPDIRLVQSEKELPRREYVYKDDVVDPMRVGRLFASGATIIFNALQDRHERVRRLCTAVAEQATMRTQANIYLTPPHSQGFEPHWDTHDVLVLQVEGNKHWRIYAGGVSRPLGTQKFDPARHKPGEVTEEFTLEAGDVLYIPRGIMHAAAATDAVSLHITLGLLAYTWAELLGDCLSELAERAEHWRENVPFGYGWLPGGVALLERELRTRLGALTDALDLEPVVSAHLQDVCGDHRPRVDDHLRQALDASGLSHDDLVEKRPGLPARLQRLGDRVVLVSGAREVSFPAAAERTLQTILHETPVPIGELDDDLDWPGRKAVISTLIREGVLARRGRSHDTQPEASYGP